MACRHRSKIMLALTSVRHIAEAPHHREEKETSTTKVTPDLRSVGPKKHIHFVFVVFGIGSVALDVWFSFFLPKFFCILKSTQATETHN
jgi:hypothetical protein